MNKLWTMVSVLLVLVLVAGACGPATPAALPTEAPTPTGDDLVALVADNNTFALDLYRALKVQEGNLFFSPYSISLALAMTYAGARGETEQQMASTLRVHLPQDRLHPAFRALDGELASRGEGARGKDGEGFRLNIANALWGQEDFAFLTQFLDLLAQNYGAGMRLVDFVGDPEKARLTINDWVGQETEGRIENLIPPGLIDELTRLVLTNAIYFNAAWSSPFEPKMTQDGPFYPLEGGEVTVPMMRQTGSFAYAEGDGYQAVELPYDGHEISMVILLPPAGQFEDFETLLDATGLEAILADLGHSQVALTLPRFEYDSQFNLKDVLIGMGMPLAFSTGADFSGMTGASDLFISEVVHKAFVAVDEAGTEAAAATAVLMPLTARQEQPVQFIADRPFLFLIRDVATGAILFVGRVADASG